MILDPQLEGESATARDVGTHGKVRDDRWRRAGLSELLLFDLMSGTVDTKISSESFTDYVTEGVYINTYI